jgi:YaeC family lipoprotein
VLCERDDVLLGDLAAGRLHAACFADGMRFAAEAGRRDGDLVAVTTTVTLPYALYSRRLRSPREVRDGEAVVLPRGRGATARALVLLHNHGLIGLREGVGLEATLADVASNPRRLRLQAFMSEQLFGALEQAALVVLDSDTATRHGLQPARDSIGLEDARSPWAGVLAVRRVEIASPWVAVLVGAYRSEAVKRFLLQRFNNSVRRPW